MGNAAKPSPAASSTHAVASLLLETLTPHALEVALTVQAELDTRAAEADALRRQHVERARHRADLARRRYLAVDPDNRLVADSLEADWNDALRALQTAREDYDRASAAAAAALTDELKDRIRSLATDFPATLVQPGHPAAGPQTHGPPPGRRRHPAQDRPHPPARPVPRRADHQPRRRDPTQAWQVRQTHPDTLAALDRLLDTHTDAQTADALNAAGHRSGEGKPFTARIVLEARRSNNLPSHADRLRANGLLTKTEIATRLGVHQSTVKSWTKAGILNSHKANDKNERLYEPPVPGDPRLTARQGSPLRKRVPT